MSVVNQWTDNAIAELGKNRRRSLADAVLSVCFVALSCSRFPCLPMKGCRNYTPRLGKKCETLTADGGEDNTIIGIETGR